MNRRERVVLLVAVLGMGLVTPVLAAVSNFPFVGIVFLGKGKQPKNTSLMSIVDRPTQANSAVCWLYTREGSAPAAATVKGDVTITRQNGPTEMFTLRSTVDFSAATGNSLGCGCSPTAFAVDPGDVLSGDFRLKKVGRLKRDEGSNLQLWIFDGVQIPALVDCGAFFP